MQFPKDKILIVITIIALLAAGYLFIRNRQLASAAEAGKRLAELEKRVEFVKDRIRAAEGISVIFQFSLQPNVEEEALALVQKRLGRLGSNLILKEWEELQKEEAREGPIYSLRVRNLFLAILHDASRMLEE